MFARVSTYNLKDGSFETVKELSPTKIEPKLRAIKGLVSTVTTFNHETSSGHTYAIYQDAASADAAKDQIADVWSIIAEHLAGPPTVEECEVVMHVTGEA